MYKLTIPPEAKDAHLSCYFDAISGALKTLADGGSVSFAGKNRFDLASTNDAVKDLCKILYRYNSKREESILVAPPKVLSSLINEIDNHVRKCQWEPSKSPYSDCLAFMKELFSYGRFSNNKQGLVYDSEASVIRPQSIKGITDARWHGLEWAPLAFIESLDVRYCPYCNAETIYSIEFDETDCNDGVVRTARSALDHYFCKAKYPYLAISLCNLVPSCTRCNTSIKGRRELSYGLHLNPYDMSFHDAVTFHVKPLSVGVGFYPSRIDNEDSFMLELQQSKTVDKKVSKMGMELAKFFRLETVYNSLFKFEALQSVYRCRIMSHGYYEYLNSILKEKISRSKFEKLVLGVPENPADIAKLRLSKLALDLYEYEKAHKKRLILRSTEVSASMIG